MNLDFIDMLDGYKAENDELLQKMEDALMEIQEDGMNNENINAVFRAAHTIKGSSGMFGIDYIVEFTHIAENLLDKVRNHKIEIDEGIIQLLLACKDQMQILIDFVMSDPEGEPDEEIRNTSQTLINELQVYLDGKSASKVVEKEEEPKTTIDSSKKHEYQVNIKFGSDTFNHGFDTYTFINYLQEMGEIKNIQTDTESIPYFTDIDPLKCYMSYVVDVHSDEDSQVIESAFDFVQDSSTISIVDLSAPKEEMKVEAQKVLKEEVVEVQQLKETKETKNKKSPVAVKQTNFIRIEASKVDSLINLIGEMVISNASVMQKATDSKSPELIESVSTVTRMLEEVRENAMQIRMVPIGETFNKFKRIVHDTANKVDKKVDLVINGGDTELDKTVVEKISDPLVHLIRNAIDHGVEVPDARIKAGKKAQGTLELNAYHDAGAITIEIIDDGNGLDDEVLFQKGVEKGLISEDDKLTQQEIFALILEPGFSTAKEVSDISGRGVGMDVVNRNIKDLRGEIEIDSQKGKGTKITIKIPLTLAIIDGFLTKVANTHFIIPLDMIVECIELNDSFKERMNGNDFINLRGTTLPLLNTSKHFNIDNKEAVRDNVVVVNYAGKKMGIVVHELLGELQTVIKPMGKVFRKLNSFSGSTILGSGEVALIMDIPILMKNMENNSKKEMAA